MFGMSRAQKDRLDEVERTVSGLRLDLQELKDRVIRWQATVTSRLSRDGVPKLLEEERPKPDPISARILQRRHDLMAATRPASEEEE